MPHFFDDFAFGLESLLLGFEHWFGALLWWSFWRITLWRILPFLEDIAILGNLATLWSLDYHALVLAWRVFTLEELGGLWFGECLHSYFDR